MELSQEQLAEEAGVSRATLQRLEAGQSVQLGSLIRVLIALGLPEIYELVPDPAVRPLLELERQERGGGQRRRAPRRRASEQGGSSDASEDDGDWSWGPDS
jgi:putative transcriptional regulator